MPVCRTILRVLLLAQAILFVPGLPAWVAFAQPSRATLVYLLSLGLLSAVAIAALQSGKSAGFGWAWAVAFVDMPAYPSLTPVGLLLALSLLGLHQGWRDAGRLNWAAAVLSISIRSWWVWLLAIGWCWLGSLQVHRFAVIGGLPETSPWALFAGAWVAAPLALLAHRLGQSVGGGAGQLATFSDWSSWADPQPVSFSTRSLRSRLMLWTLGGPVVTLALGLCLMLALVLSPGTELEPVGEIAGLGAVSALAVFFVSLLPWQAGGYQSRGRALLAILRRTEAYHRDCALVLLAGDWRRGVPPRNWDASLLRQAASLPDHSRHHATACALNYMHCLDVNAGASARHWIARLAGEFDQHRHCVPLRWRLEIAFYLAAFDDSGRVSQATSWLNCAGVAPSVPQALLLRCRAAFAYLSRNLPEALALVNKAERCILAAPGDRLADFELELQRKLAERVSMPEAAATPGAAVPALSPLAFTPRIAESV